MPADQAARFPTRGKAGVARLLRDAAVFAPCYIVLDWASYIDPVGPFNITPWSPQAALAIVWMLLAGVAHAPTVLATIFLSDVLVRNAPGGYTTTALSALLLVAGYAGIAFALATLLKDAGLRTARDLAVFCSVILLGAAGVGGGFVGALLASGQLGSTPFLDAWVRFWVGDAVGVLVTAPLLLAAADAARRSALIAMVRVPEALLQATVLAATVWLIFGGFPGDPARLFYLLFLPLIWIAVRSGMNGAIVATAIVQTGVVLGIHNKPISFSIVELQALVAALTLTGLFLGVMVDERQRAEEGLRQTLRLAAAGEMAGAIAHEVNQPLTALANYGRSAQMLLAGKVKASQLQEIIGKMVSEADRAGDVVRRLRDFFRTGTTRLESVEVSHLLSAARRAGEKVIGTAGIALDVESAGELPALFIDPVQVELVLRNLVANAVDSLAASGRDGARIEIRAEREGAQHVRIVVADNGPGILPATRERLFQPFVSGKPVGMGLGLAVSRAIAEAHGGSLEAHATGHGEFHLVLPCVRHT